MASVRAAGAQEVGPPVTESPLGEITMLCCSGSVDDYSKQFIALACRDIELTEKQQVQLFIAGLVNPLKTDVALQRPASLDDAIMLARAYEQRQMLEPETTPSGSRSTHIPALPAPTDSTGSTAASSAMAGSGKLATLSAAHLNGDGSTPSRRPVL